jgi:hypothetical protein
VIKFILLLGFGSNKCKVLFLIQFHHLGIGALCFKAVNFVSSYALWGFGLLGEHKFDCMVWS